MPDNDGQLLVETLEQQANNDGNIDAMFKLGAIYLTGKGVDVDFQQAITWLERASKLGHANAMLNLAIIYHKGKSIPQDTTKDTKDTAVNVISVDMAKAIYWYERAAMDTKSMKAMSILAYTYDNGYEDLISKDTMKAIYWYEQAAEAGSVNDMFNLALTYYEGDGSPKVQDITKAIYWFEKAAMIGDRVDAMFHLATIYEEKRNDIDKTIYWYQQAAQKGLVQAMFNLALLYYTPIIVNNTTNNKSRDIEQAIYYWKQAATTNEHAGAMYNLGILYEKGKDHILPDPQQAIQWYTQAANAGNAESMLILGGIFDQGRIVSRDMSLAVKWYTQAAKAGNCKAMYNLGHIYETGVEAVNGSSIETDVDLAIYWYKQAVQKGQHVTSMYHLALIYDNPSTSQYDISEAIYWYEQAAMKGQHVISSFNLGLTYYRGYKESIPKDVVKALYWFQYGYSQLQHTNTNTDTDTTSTMLDNEDLWALQWCQYQVGQIYMEQQEFLKAESIFQQLIDQYQFYMAYLGLSSLQSTNESKIQLLIKAAEYGITEAWRALTLYIDDPVLHSQWSVKNIATLRSFLRSTGTSTGTSSGRRSQRHPHHFVYCDASSTNSSCLFCNHQSFVIGTRRESYQILSNHLDEEYFDLTDEEGEESERDSNSSGSSDRSELIRNNNNHGSSTGRLKGGQGEVMFARILTANESSSVIVALKRPLVNSAMQLESELRHLQILQDTSMSSSSSSSIQHIVQCYGHTMIDHHLYVVMEGAMYGDLNNFLLSSVVQDYLQSSSSSSGLRLILQWFSEIASGLQHMHRFYIRHGDIKPHNVLLFDHLHVKLADLGFSSKSLALQRSATENIANTNNIVGSNDDDGDVESNGDRSLSTTIETSISTSISISTSRSASCIQGTVVYMSPEQRNGHHPTLSSDMFSFGMTCVHILNGKSPGMSFQRELMKAKENVLELYDSTTTVTVAERAVVEQIIAMMEQCVLNPANTRPTAEECVMCFNQLIETVYDNGSLSDNEEFCELLSNIRDLRLYSI